MAMPASPASILPLKPALRHYAWGDPEFIPSALGTPADGRPVAEAWYGAHPVAPATAKVGGEQRPLDEVLADAGPRILGTEAEARFGDLPYLLKLLAADRPLSIQVHPSQARAAAGFDRDNAAGLALDDPGRHYRDPHAKPELLVALTPFAALCGFRPPAAIAAALEELPEVRTLLPRLDSEAGRADVRRLVEAWFDLSDHQVQPALQTIIDRFEDEARRAPPPATSPVHWALRAHGQLRPEGPPDRGLLFVFLLELVHLEPGEGLFLPAGVPHAYLSGAGVEVMASSDNVLRAGLTSKPVDPAELLRVVRWDAGRPPVLSPTATTCDEQAIYPTPSEEFDLRRLDLRPGESIIRRAHGPETLLVLSAKESKAVTVGTDGKQDSVGLHGGEAVLIADGTDWRLEAHNAATVFRVRLPGGEKAETYRGRIPTELRFGTSGLRGWVKDITDLEAYVNCRGFLDVLIAGGDAVPGTPVAIAGDLRPSTESPDRSIVRAVIHAVKQSGLEPVWCGRIPTPALTHFGLQRGWPSIMVTGSHIPFDRNGIKFNKPHGEVLKSDEPAILAAVARVRYREYVRRSESSAFDDGGWLREDAVPELPPPTDAAAGSYVRRYLEAFPQGALEGLRVALYEHSAVGREMVAEVLRGLGAEVVTVGRSEEFVAIDTEAISAEQLADLQKLADQVREEHGPIHAVVSTDGDSDRPLLLAVDAGGQLHFYGGDVLGAVVADALAADAIAVPVSANDLIDTHFASRGITVQRTRIGSPWVIAAMESMEGERRVGWEANGGFLTASTLSIEGGGELAPLPTRDAVLPLVTALFVARKRGGPLNDLFAELPSRISRAGLIDDVDPAAGQALLQCFGDDDRDIRRIRFDESGAIYWSDHDGREHPATGESSRRWRRTRDALATQLTAERGFGPPQEVDLLDGLRIRCQNGDVVHVRPSGNAPQLRIYATADSPERADEIVAWGVREPDGLLRELLAASASCHFQQAIEDNIAGTTALVEEGGGPQVIGTVCGSAAAQTFWQRRLKTTRRHLGAREAVSLHEDLPVNQAFGLLLLWKRLRPHLRAEDGALMAFVFGEGTRATPWTEAECGQKPAIASPALVGEGEERRPLTTVELALRHFIGVEAHLRRSGFNGVVVKWGDEVQIPRADLAGTNPRFLDADVVRFVSLTELTAENAPAKDWVGVAPDGRICAFLPRRPLAEMEQLADRGLLQRRGGRLFGGINLGSIAVSRALLDVLLEEFDEEIVDDHADRTSRPDLDPQFFTALCIAALADPDERERTWDHALRESAVIRHLEANLPGIRRRLEGALERFATRHGRPVKLVAMDFGDQYWGDIGQHRQIHDLFLALRDRGPEGEVARALAGTRGEFDDHGNLILGNSYLGEEVHVRDSVLVDVRIHAGDIQGSVLLGTHCGAVRARKAFDLFSTVGELELAPRAGAYKVVDEGAVKVSAGERVTTVFLPRGDLLLRVHEDTDLRNREANYDQPILGNPISFAEAHDAVLTDDPDDVNERRGARRRDVADHLGGP